MDSEELRRLRERLGLTQEQLARELGVHRVSVARWETGEHRIPEPVARLLGRLRQEAKAKKRRK